MIKKLKLKFIISNMVIVSIIMLAVFGIQYYRTSKVLESKSLAAMKNIAESDVTIHKIPFSKDNDKNSYHYLFTYVIDYNEKNESFCLNDSMNTETLNDEQLRYINEIITYVNNQDEDEGIFEKYNLRFYRTNTSNGIRIVVLNKLLEDRNLNEMIISFSLSGGMAFIAFFILSIILSGIVVKPVEKSLKQQQQLISDVSHELKTPITVISTNTDIVLSHNESTVEEQRKWLGYIKDETKRMSDLVSMMLYLAKTDEMVNTTTLSEFDLSNTVYEIALPFESVCFENNKIFNMHVQSDITIKGDENSIKQLLVILLDNAVKYSNQNGRIELTLKASGEKAILSIFNSGEPIPKTDIPHLFDRFYRVDQARSHDVEGGSGLGLSIAKRIIENNEASISVTSNIEHGTQFSCIFNTVKQKYYK